MGDESTSGSHPEGRRQPRRGGAGAERQAALPSLRPRGNRAAYTPRSAADPLPREAPPAPRTRYVFQRCLARGGMGEVWLAKDLRLNREVAIKLVKAERAGEARVVNAVIHEARLTARVEHPNIVPVHDLGVTEDGRFFYTMKRVHGQSLSHILRAQAKGHQQTIEEYSLNLLLGILRQVCLAVAFVHSRGVLHRDLKPSNIMIGEYGEVMLIDWGLARLKIKKDGDDISTMRRTELVQGTPAYMPPEQAQYGLPGTDERSDVYSLGAILYQTMTLRPPYRRKKTESLEDYLKRIVSTTPPSPDQVAPHRDLPADLVALTRRCMDKDPARRLQDARALARELELHIEGKKAEARRKANAAERVELAHRAVDRLRRQRDKLEEQHELLEEASAETPAWSDAQRRELLFRLEEDARRTERDVAETFGQAVRHFHEALTYLPQDAEARAGLADLYWERFRAAEAAGSETERVQYEALIRHFDEKRYATRLRGEGSLRVESTPPGAQVHVAPVVERHRRFEAQDPVPIGATPVGPRPLSMGSHVVIVDRPGREPYRHPVHMGREERLVVHADLDVSLPAGFELVPGGAFSYGERPSRRLSVEGFGLARFPVTFGQYLEFIDDLDGTDRFEAWQRLPRSGRIPGHRWTRRGESYVLEADGVRIEDRFPVVGISHEDAQAYCAWLSRRDGRSYRLPTEVEWEKAARGPDGRTYPWGNGFDPSFCLMRATRESGPAVDRVGSVEGDVSPYGVRDMAGLVREWCGGWHNEGVGHRPIRGGSWSDGPEACAATRRRGAYPTMTDDNVGFRVLVEIEPAGELEPGRDGAPDGEGAPERSPA